MQQRPPRQRLSSNALALSNVRMVGKPEVIPPTVADLVLRRVPATASTQECAIHVT